MEHFILGTRDPRIFVQGRFVSGRPINPSSGYGCTVKAVADTLSGYMR